MAKDKAAAKPMTKSEIVSGIAEKTGLAKKDINAVFEVMGTQIKKSLGKSGVGAYTVPGLMKLMVLRKPATKARKGINPFTGEETMFKAKPARNVVKIRPLKNLKDMV
ncbi:MAG: HU family DNA-binding protein [Sedimentisphaerales bacterium]|nr:HU family DNA-binding protein [Sedimentisphaerales bacterium]